MTLLCFDGQTLTFIFFLLCLGEVAEQMNNLDLALTAYEHALRHNPRCVPALSQVAGIARIKENYPKVSSGLVCICRVFFSVLDPLPGFPLLFHFVGVRTGHASSPFELGVAVIYPLAIALSCPHAPADLRILELTSHLNHSQSPFSA